MHNDIIYKHEKTLALAHILKQNEESLNIACSGGLDSRFLAFFARCIGIKNTQLLHVTGEHIEKTETDYLKEWAKKHHFPLHIINLDILEEKKIQTNDPLRCYYCKHKAFSAMLPFCKNAVLHDGTHFDDTKAHRPGLKALFELNILSPLALSGFTKDDIHFFAREITLDNPKQKAKPCLLTRFDYNTLITKEKLEFIAKAEKIAEEVFKKASEENLIQSNNINFRIRETKQNIFELHSTENFTKSLLCTLQNAFKKANINNIQCKTIQVLSGYFDKKR